MAARVGGDDGVEEAGGQCDVCQLPAALRCARCKAVWYCSQVCQKFDWPVHKPDCKRPRYPPAAAKPIPTATAASKKAAAATTTAPAPLDPRHIIELNLPKCEQPSILFNCRDKDDLDRESAASSGPTSRPGMFIVKIQVWVTPPKGQNVGPMMIYNEDRSLVHHFDHTVVTGGIAKLHVLDSLIRAKGPRGLKGYFFAKVQPNGKLIVHIDELASVPAW